MSRIRSSSLPGLYQCGGYTPDQSTGEKQKSDGTKRHDVLARLLTAEAARVRGKHQRDTEAEEAILAELPDEQAEGVLWAYDYIRTRAAMRDYPLEVEQRITFVGPDFETHRGHADVICGADVFDLKWREGVADYEAQLASYALTPLSRGFPTVRAHILYGAHEYAEVIEFTLETAQALVAEAIENATAAEPVLRTGMFCRWCVRRLKCPAVLAEAEAAEKSPAPDTITDPAVMGEYWRRAKILEAWAESVSKAARKMAVEQGIEPAGTKLMTRKGNPSITDPEAGFSLAGLPQDKYMRACKPSLDALADAFAEFHGIPKSAAREQLNRRLAAVISRGAPITYLRAAKTK